MRELLSKHDIRQLSLLEYLIKNRQNWLLLKDVSEYLQLPIRTIRSDISEINRYITPLYVKSSSSGVRIIIPPNYSERYIYLKILEESREFKIIEYVFTSGRETIESLSNKLYVSESTIKRMIKEINRVLRKEEFYICGKPLSFKGNERKLIHFMSMYSRERYLFQNELMTPVQREVINKLINGVLAESGKEMHFPNFKRISTWVYLGCIRLKNGHRIPIVDPKDRFPVQILNDENFCSQFHEVMGVRLSEDTIKQLFFVFSSKGYAFNMKEMDQLIQRNDAQKALSLEIKKVMHILSVQLSIPLNHNTENMLLLDVMNIINLKKISSGYTFVLYDHREYFLSYLSMYYVNLRSLINNKLIENISVDFSENEWNELNYIFLTHWPELYQKIRFIEMPIKVFLLMDTDIEHGELIKNELNTYCRYHIEIENIISYSLEQMRELSADSILITNMPGLPEMRCFTLCFGEFLNSRDWQEFNRMIHVILSNRKKTEVSR